MFLIIESSVKNFSDTFCKIFLSHWMFKKITSARLHTSMYISYNYWPNKAIKNHYQIVKEPILNLSIK